MKERKFTIRFVNIRGSEIGRRYDMTINYNMVHNSLFVNNVTDVIVDVVMLK